MHRPALQDANLDARSFIGWLPAQRACWLRYSLLGAATVFHSNLRSVIAFAAFSGAYALIYLLMKSEDYALLIGSITAFSALALTMIVTRNLDWYGARTKE